MCSSDLSHYAEWHRLTRFPRFASRPADKSVDAWDMMRAAERAPGFDQAEALERAPEFATFLVVALPEFLERHLPEADPDYLLQKLLEECNPGWRGLFNCSSPLEERVRDAFLEWAGSPEIDLSDKAPSRYGGLPKDEELHAMLAEIISDENKLDSGVD